MEFIAVLYFSVICWSLGSFIYLSSHGWLYVYLCTLCMEGQKREEILLELELPIVVSCDEGTDQTLLL